MSARTKARKRALDVLFQADLKGVDPCSVFDEFSVQADGPLNPYTEEIVRGVAANQARIDEVITTYAHDWTLTRMPVVDRNLVRLASWEIIYNPDVPDGVAIDEAVELAKSLSTDESPAFINGLLAKIADAKDLLGIES